jgi:hypothetical protein
MAITAAMRMGAEGIRIMCAADWAVLKWQELNSIKKEEFLFIQFVQILIMQTGRAETIYGSHRN